MSISLNDHETRIKALENYQLKSSLVKEVVYNGKTTGTVSIPNLTNYDTICVLVQEDCHEGGGDLAWITPEFYDTNIPMNHVNAHASSSIKIETGNKRCVFIANDHGSIRKIIGLKWWGGGINLGTLLKRLLVYIKTYSKLFHFHLSEVK